MPSMRDAVLLTAADAEFGLVAAVDALAMAQQIANDEREAVTLREPTTDAVLAVVEPEAAAQAATPA